VAVAGELHAVLEARAQVIHEGHCILCATAADAPRDDELRVGVDAGPRPRISCAVHIRRDLLRDVLVLGVGEAPISSTWTRLAGTFRTMLAKILKRHPRHGEKTQKQRQLALTSLACGFARCC
jgi:hypothetical protein